MSIFTNIENEIQKTSYFNIKGTKGKIVINEDFGVVGRLFFDNDNNYVAFTFEDNEFTYHEPSIRYSPLKNEEVKQLEPKMFQLIYLNRQFKNEVAKQQSRLIKIG